MKKAQATENRDLQQFQQLLLDRLDTLDERMGTGDTRFHSGTERLLIHLAFDRIHKNEYWHCVKCGGEIAEQRLLADPTTLTCLECEPGAAKKPARSAGAS
jgi:RNA polymerase-binding transcription factor DksA